MKRLFLMIIPALICGVTFMNCASKEAKPSGKKTTWELDGLTGKGKPKRVNTIWYSVITDTLGQLHKEETYNVILKYDEKGQWTEWSNYYKDGGIIGLEILEFDSEGNPIEMLVYRQGNIHHRRVFTNDNRGNIIEVYRYDANDSLFAKSFHRYDEYDYEIEAYRYSATDSLISKTVSNYDKNGYLIESIVYGNDGSLTTKTLFMYDNLGNRIERTIYDLDKILIEKTTYKYDEKRFAIEVNTFNSKDNTNTKITYSYQYDTNDNWVERIEYNDGIAVRIIEKNIEYYE